MITKMFLEDLDKNLKVITAFSPSESLELIKSHNFDCIVSDYKMPEMNGIDLAWRIWKQRKIPYIIYTGLDNSKIEAVSYASGVDFVISKSGGPEHYTELIEHIRMAVEKHLTEDMFHILVENSQDGILVFIDQELVYSNQSCIELFGCKSIDELLGNGFMNFLMEKDQIKFVEILEMNALQKLKEGKFSFKVSSRLKGNKKIECLFTPNNFMGKKSLQVYLRDITDLDNFNKKLKKSNEDLENYTYVVSHDLKAPLRSLRAFSSFLLDDYEDKLDEEGKLYLNRIIEASTRMNNLIEDLLILSRVGRKFTEEEILDLNVLLNNIINDFESTLKEKNGKIVVENLPTIKIQKTWISQLFTNLIDNGIKFNKSEAPRIHITVKQDKSNFIFSVKDNGIGIEKQYQEKVFELFERLHTRDEYDGTGAGLAICKKIVEEFGGKIWVESDVLKGSVFHFTIPRALSEIKLDQIDAQMNINEPLAVT
jgi:PAS domain S-box-containing protein